LVFVEGADHFFLGKLDLMQAALRAWIEHHFPVTVPAQ
jgi:alpha/beta superfamily hydrolase